MEGITIKDLRKHYGENVRVIKTVRSGNNVIRKDTIEPINDALIRFFITCNNISDYIHFIPSPVIPEPVPLPENNAPSEPTVEVVAEAPVEIPVEAAAEEAAAPTGPASEQQPESVPEQEAPVPVIEIDWLNVTPRSVHSDELKLEKFLMVRNYPKMITNAELSQSGINMGSLHPQEYNIGKFRMRRVSRRSPWLITKME